MSCEPKKVFFEFQLPYYSTMYSVLIFLIGTAFFIWRIKVHSTRPVGLIINGVIELGPTGALYFSIGMAILAFGLAIWYFLEGIKLFALQHPECIHFESDELVLEVGFLFSQKINISYSEIDRIYTSKIDGDEKFRTIFFHQNQIRLFKEFLPSCKDWDEMKLSLFSCINSRKQSVQISEKKMEEQKSFETLNDKCCRLVETYNKVKQKLETDEGKKQMSLFVHSKIAPWRVSINSDYGR